MEKRVYRAYRKTVSIVNESAISMYQNLAAGRTGFLVENSDEDFDSFTLMGVDPEEIITSRDGHLVIRRRDGEEVCPGNPLDALKEYFSSFEIRTDQPHLPFRGGLVGSLAYDFVRFSEDLPDNNPDEIGIGDIQLMLMKEFLVADYEAETLAAVILESDDPDGRQRAETRAQELLTIARQHREPEELSFVHDGVIVKKSDTLEEYGEKVEKIRHYIREGDVFQTVLSQRWTIQTKRDGFELYQELRQVNPSPYMFYLNFGEFEIIGSSPEMIVKQSGNQVYTVPIAGTRPRGKTPEEDAALRDEMLADEKERAEHAMLVDLARNDMGRISDFGTVKVTEFMGVQSYSHVMHIVSKVQGKKKGSYHPLDLVSSFLPAGTLSGAPKIRAMEIIDELEDIRRGIYGGATGYLDFSGDMDFCFTIRSMLKKGDNVYLQAGAGIVADSVPTNEYYECCNKVMAMAKTLVEEENL